MNRTLSEYESIRNELIAMEDQQRNVWLHMYTLFITIFILGIELSYNLLLVTYIILIPFQIVINRYKISILKMSIYIKIFYEKDIAWLNWEGLQTFRKSKEYYIKIDTSIEGILGHTGSSQLGLLSTIFFCVLLLHNRYSNDIFSLSIKDVFLIAISICLCFVVINLNRAYKKNHHEDLENLISSYKESLQTKEK